MSARTHDPADLSLTLQPERSDDGRVVFDVEGVRVSLTPRGTGWDYERPGLGRPVHVSGVGDALPSFRVRVAADEAVARFLHPVFIPGSAAIDLWVAWPLEVVVVVGEDDPLDHLSPGFRRTLLGTVNEGRVLAGAVCDALSGPDDESVAGRPIAALSLRIRNHGTEPARVSRVPVFGGSLTLFRRNGSFAVGAVRTDVHADGHAEATTRSAEPPRGFAVVARPTAAQHGSHLGWLLDATRRSVEFPL